MIRFPDAKLYPFQESGLIAGFDLQDSLLDRADFASANANPVFISALCSIIRSENVPQMPAALALQAGSRVRIDNLHAKPQYNGRNGVVCGAFDHDSGRWTVDVEASDAGPAFQLLIRSANLTLLTSASDTAPSAPAPPLTAKQQAQIMAHAFGSHVLPLVRKAQSHVSGAMCHFLEMCVCTACLTLLVRGA